MNIGDVNKKTLLKILDWCKEKYGPSKFNSMNTLKLRVNNRIKGECGNYTPVNNTIYVNITAHDSLIEVIDTVIHEYVHFRQDIKNKYHKLYMETYSYNVDNHPYEKTAYGVALNDRRECYNDLFTKKYE